MEALQSPTISRIPSRKRNNRQNPVTMNRHAQRITIAAATLLFIGQPALEARPWHDNNVRTEYQREALDRHNSFSGELHLTRGQERQFLSLRDNYEEKGRKMERRLAMLRKEHRQAVRKARASNNRAHRIMKQIRREEAAINRHRERYYSSLRRVCRPDQRERFDTMLRYQSPSLAVLIRF